MNTLLKSPAQVSPTSSVLLATIPNEIRAQDLTRTARAGKNTATPSSPATTPGAVMLTPTSQGSAAAIVFTSTPLPTLPPGSWPSPTATRYHPPTKPPSFYFGLMQQLYQAMIGQWRGMVSITVNRQARPAQFITLEFMPTCQTGQACGKYHWDSGCFGDLVLMKWRPKTLVFRNIEYSGSDHCPDWVEYSLQPKPGDTLYLSMSFRDEDRRRIIKGVTLRRR